MSAPLLAARGLSVDIGGHQVVRGLDLDIAAGQRLAGRTEYLPGDADAGGCAAGQRTAAEQEQSKKHKR